MTDSKYFSATRDRKVIDGGGFFCLACLVGKLASEQSPDPRYCLNCYEVLVKEAELAPAKIKRTWQPVPGRVEALQDKEEVVTKPTTKGIAPVKDIQEVLLQKNKGGRPRKLEGESVTRMTEWRRQKKEKQEQGAIKNA